ncbi:MAG: sulfatase [Planctomycetota bacterium]
MVVFLLLGILLLVSNNAAAQDQPNVVMILSDDQAWTDYSFMGHETIKTPNIDRLASESVVFRRGYVPTSLCRPSLMTIVTGRYAHQHGVTGNDPSFKNAPRGSELSNQKKSDLISLIDKWETIPRRLAARNYVSHQSGKWWEGNFRRGGFTHGMTRGFPQKGGRHGDDGLKIGRNGIQPVTDFIDQAVSDENPFLVWYAPFLPHTPHNPPKRLLKKYAGDGLPETVAKYYAMCEWFDETVGELLEHLEDRKIRDNTLVIYVCDNGWIQNPEKNGYAQKSKQTPYEGGIRTPIMFSWPAKLQPADRSELCSSIDIFPTVMAAVGLESPVDLPGINLLPNMVDSKAIERSCIFGEGFAHDIADIQNPEASLLYRWCIEGKWKLILTYDGEIGRYASTHPRTELRPQLFDLVADPNERSNVARSNPEIVAKMVNKIEDWYPVEQREVQKTW